MTYELSAAETVERILGMPRHPNLHRGECAAGARIHITEVEVRKHVRDSAVRTALRRVDQHEARRNVEDLAEALGNGDWVVSQDFDGASLILTRFDSAGKRLGSMKIASSDHGDRLESAATMTSSAGSTSGPSG